MPDFHMINNLMAFAENTRGAVFCLFLIALCYLLPANVKLFIFNKFNFRYDRISVGAYSILVSISIVYLFYPNYLDHVESSITWLGLVLRSGGDLYPWPETYPYHGLLYGPLLSEVEALFLFLGLPLVIASKLPGVLAFTLASFLMFKSVKGVYPRGYLIYLLPFGLFAFWNRAEPFLLLFVAILLFAGRQWSGSKLLPILAGLLAGLASGAKLHGAAYVLCAYLAVSAGFVISLGSFILFGLSAAIVFLALFIPDGVSLISFYKYLRMAGDHGISGAVLWKNILYLFVLLIPVMCFYVHWRKENKFSYGLLMLGLIELGIAFIGGKPGAGEHHLMPLVFANAFLMYKLSLGSSDVVAFNIRIIYLSLIIPAIISTVNICNLMLKGWRDQALAVAELRGIGNKYPGVVMGLSDDKGYEYVYLRVLLAHGQIDYPAYMDLALSGVNDHALSKRLSSCSIKFIVMPNIGIAFSMHNFYTGKPLFSNEVRQAFSKNYKSIQVGEKYSIYACHGPRLL